MKETANDRAEMTVETRTKLNHEGDVTTAVGEAFAEVRRLVKVDESPQIPAEWVKEGANELEGAD
ncbi:MAG: hypothetical protein EHM21_06835 [Chloroflexi bacterium]|nr:MAG: hypothetical protein EHM21_06835 [Chloroflexota bacterium]